MPNSLPARPYVRSSVPQPRPVRLRRRLATIGGLGLAGLIAGLLSGCSLSANSLTATAPTTAGDSAVSWASVAGNWGFASAGTPASANRLTSLGGSLAVNGSSVTATLHPLVSGQCLASSEILTLTGTISSGGALTLAGESAKGVSVKIGGTLATDRHSLENPALAAVGAACSGATPHLSGLARPRDGVGITAQQYQPVSGTFSGTLTDVDGDSFPLTTTVSEIAQPDTDGTYHIQGTANAPDNACVPGAVTATASVLSGGSISATYSDGNGTTITASGYASADGTTIALTSWQITGACGTASGSGTLTRQ